MQRIFHAFTTRLNVSRAEDSDAEGI